MTWIAAHSKFGSRHADSHLSHSVSSVQRCTANPKKFLFQDEIGGLEVEDPNEPGKYVVRSIVRPHRYANVIANMDVEIIYRPCLPSPTQSLSMREFSCGNVRPSFSAADGLVQLCIIGSNDTIRSTTHRVTAPPTVGAKGDLLLPRYSIPYVSFLP